MLKEVLPPVEIAPVALFQIIKDIKMGPSRGFSSGSLYGVPCDPDNLDTAHPIEVSHAFPDFSRNGYQRIDCEKVEEEFIRYVGDVKRNTEEHLLAVRKLNMDQKWLGTYTSRNSSSVLSFDDLKCLYDDQKDDPYAFKLIVTLSEQSISFRAFRFSQEALDYLEKSRFFAENSQISKVDSAMLFQNMLVSVPVRFRRNEIDDLMLDEMLASFNLIGDVFRLRNMAALKAETDLSEALDGLTDDVKRPAGGKVRHFVNQSYEYHAKSKLVQTTLKEERTKMQAMMALKPDSESS